MTLTTDGNDIFKSLNKAQCLAVRSTAPTVAILAGPGSGKTHTLTSRIVWLMDHIGIQPQDIIVATFTNKASNEMKARIGHVFRDGREKKIIIGTFHSIARRYLVKYGKRIGLDPKFGIADDSDSRAIITRICKRLDNPLEPAVVRAWISKRKAKGTSDEQIINDKKGQKIQSQAFETCFLEYQNQLQRSTLLDYDDLLVRCVELLRKFPQCVSNVQTVLIDEYQDTNGVQYDLMKLFAQKHRRITIVGDPDQSIYGWRSAEIKNLHRLLREYPGTDEISLEENYRSSKCILEASLNVIQQDQDRYEKTLLPVRDKGTRPVLRRLKNSTEEADWIVSEIKRIRLLSGNMLDFDDFAILLRSAALSRYVESTLGREGISYRMVGGFKFYERAEIKILLDYMRIIHQPDNNDAFARIINIPKRGVGEVTIKALLEEAEKSSLSLWQLVGKHCRGQRTAKTNIRPHVAKALYGSLINPLNQLRDRVHSDAKLGAPLNLIELVQRLLRDLKFEAYLKATFGPEFESRWANVKEFVTLAEEFMRQSQIDDEPLPAIDGFEQTSGDDILARFLSNVSLASDKQKEDNNQEGKPLVTLSTIHAAKGLEWPVVFIPAVYNGSIPHVRAEDQSEERRLLYVAMTRAKALLYLSCPLNIANGDGGRATELSPFIDRLPSSTFLHKGPSFDRPVMTAVAKILGRELPLDSDIYKGIPLMTPPEDNLYPIDPRKPLHCGATDEASNYSGPRKRQKLEHVQVSGESVEGWAAPYKTTMQNATSFTVPHAAGFITASAHMASAAAEKSATNNQPASGSTAHGVPRKSASNRPINQRSLLGYGYGYGYGVTNHDQSKHVVGPAEYVPSITKLTAAVPAPYGRRRLPQNGYSLPPLPHATTSSIEPALANHRLGAAKLSTIKPPTRQDESVATPSKQYSYFSSSPTRPSTESSTATPVAAKQLASGGGGSGKEKEHIPPEALSRPATCFHATTVAGPPGWRGGINRPMGLGRSGITPIEKLNKPYKLTVKRP